MADSLLYSEHAYATENELQRLAVWQFPENRADRHVPDGTRKYWLVYIHGGAWRDPRTDLTSILPGMRKLLSETETTANPSAISSDRIAGFASLNYRLSPHPSFPQDPAATPASQLRVARHPDHLRDVRAALSFLRRRYGIGSVETPYVLYGHSCGATLALQVLMGEDVLRSGAAAEKGEEIPLPAAVIGFQGIYDLPGLNARKGGAYAELWTGAFGPDEREWIRVSPARFAGNYKEAWRAGEAQGKNDGGSGGGGTEGLAVLAFSPEDELIDMPEVDAMEEKLRNDGVRVLAYRDLKGKHDEVYLDGMYVARVLGQTLEDLGALHNSR